MSDSFCANLIKLYNLISSVQYAVKCQIVFINELGLDVKTIFDFQKVNIFKFIIITNLRLTKQYRK